MPLNRGDIVTCPECHLPMVKCVRVPKFGERPDYNHFKPINHHYNIGDSAQCPKCKATYIDMSRGAYVRNKGWTW